MDQVFKAIAVKEIYVDRTYLYNTTSSTVGVIFKGTDRFIHNFKHPTGGGAVPAGQNTFVGLNAGNFTMGSTATITTHGSYNTGIGYTALSSNTTGYSNTGIGTNSLLSNTTGYSNTGIGHSSLAPNTTGYRNTGVGRSSLLSNTDGYFNTAIGGTALSSNTTGYSNTGIGLNAGRYITGGANPNETSNTSVYLGTETKASADGNSNEIVIGYDVTGAGSNTVTLGNSSITKSILRGNVGVGVSAFGTNGTNVIGINADAVVPADNPAGMIQIFADDSSGGASNATLAIRTEEAVTSEVLACDTTLNIWVNGVEYHLLMRAV